MTTDPATTFGIVSTFIIGVVGLGILYRQARKHKREKSRYISLHEETQKEIYRLRNENGRIRCRYQEAEERQDELINQMTEQLSLDTAMLKRAFEMSTGKDIPVSTDPERTCFGFTSRLHVLKELSDRTRKIPKTVAKYLMEEVADGMVVNFREDEDGVHILDIKMPAGMEPKEQEDE